MSQHVSRLLRVDTNVPRSRNKMKTCTGCNRIHQQNCGSVRSINYNGGLTWRKLPDQRCPKEIIEQYREELTFKSV